LAFDLPSTSIKRILPFADRIWLLRAMRFVLGQVLNLVLAPVFVLLQAIQLRKFGARAVFSHNGGWPAGPLCRWMICAAILARAPVRVFIVHNYPEKTGSWLLASMVLPLRCLRAKLIDWCATAIVTVSDSVKLALESQVFRSRVLRIHNGIPLAPSPVPDEVLEWHPQSAALGFVGALYPLKGPHVLLDAFELVDIPCELALLGPAEVEYKKSLEQQAMRCRNKVTFLGFHQDVDSFMDRIELLVVPSIAYESFGMVILEAMKHRKPVICSDFGGMKEVVEHGVTGLVVPAGDKQALAKAIVALMSDAGVRRQMGEAGSRRLAEHFTSDKMAAQYEQLMLEI
jgi:glycosyltransferase involved in cell wall biosynthesis